MNYYNEFDPKAAAWLRQLITDGLIPAGHVDERSICDVQPGDLDGFTQCHFFAGIGGWPLALQLAGVSSDEHLWTGSCPCQPFSAAGKGEGQADERHLWPELRRLISKCHPATVIGEQVASAAGRDWLSGVRSDLEGMGYAVGAADLCAASAEPEMAARIWIPGDFEGDGSWAPVSIGPPHIRQRLFWVGVSNCAGRVARKPAPEAAGYGNSVESAGCDGGMADAASMSGAQHVRESRGGLRRTKGPEDAADRGGDPGRLVYPVSPGSEGHAGNGDNRNESGRVGAKSNGPATAAGGWGNFDIVQCADGKARRVESGIHPLANGVSGRVGLLRGYGNAIVPQVAAEFIKACLEVI